MTALPDTRMSNGSGHVSTVQGHGRVWNRSSIRVDKHLTGVNPDIERDLCRSTIWVLLGYDNLGITVERIQGGNHGGTGAGWRLVLDATQGDGFGEASSVRSREVLSMDICNEPLPVFENVTGE